MDTVTRSVLPYHYDWISEDVLAKIQGYPPGVIGVATGFLGRYREFDACLNIVWKPPTTETIYYIGVDVCKHFNSMVRSTLAKPENEWLWILGDDHAFCQDLWLNLYERNVDIVVPLCLRKNAKPIPILDDPTHKISPTEAISGKSGLLEWGGLTGNAGMLIRRRVFEQMEPPWFRAGQDDPEYSGSDYYFCRAAHRAGLKIYVDLDNPIGHIHHFAIWPRRDENGEWYVDYR